MTAAETSRQNRDEPPRKVPFQRLWLTAPGQGAEPLRHPYELQVRRAELLDKAGDWPAAEALCRQNADWCRAAGFRAERSESLMALCRIRRNMGKPEGMLEMVTEALALRQQLDDPKGLIRCHVNLGLVHALEGRLADAVREYNTAAAMAETAGNERLLTSALGNLGQVQMLLGEYQQSIDTNTRVIELCHKHGDEYGVAIANCNLGNVYFFQNRYGRAMECYLIQARHAQRCGDILSYSVAIGNIGNIHNLTGDPAQAMTCYREKLQLSERLGYIYGTGQALGNIANLLLDAGDIDGATAYDTRLLAIAEQSGDAELLASACIDLGALQQIRNAHPRALELIDRAVAISREAGLAYNLAMGLARRADTMLQLGDAAAARRDAEEGFETAERIGDSEIALDCAIAAFKAAAASDPAAAAAGLAGLFDRYPGQKNQVLIAFELFALTGSEQHRAAALELYRGLEPQARTFLMRQKIEQLEDPCTDRAGTN